MSGGNGYDKLEVYPLGENLFGSEYRVKVDTSVGISDGKNYGKLERSPMGHFLDTGSGTMGGSSYGSSYEA